MKPFGYFVYFVLWPQATALDILLPGRITSFEYTVRERRILWWTIFFGLAAQLTAFATWYYGLSWLMYALAAIGYIILAFVNILSADVGGEESESDRWNREIHGDTSSDRWGTRHVEPH